MEDDAVPFKASFFVDWNRVILHDQTISIKFDDFFPCLDMAQGAANFTNIWVFVVDRIFERDPDIIDVMFLDFIKGELNTRNPMNVNFGLKESLQDHLVEFCLSIQARIKIDVNDVAKKQFFLHNVSLREI